MSDPELSPSRLPRVEAADILSLVLSEVLDPAYVVHWELLSRANPDLARAILERAAIVSESKPDEQKHLVDMGIFVTEAIAAALARQRQTRAGLSDGGADSQPSDEPMLGS